MLRSLDNPKVDVAAVEVAVEGLRKRGATCQTLIRAGRSNVCVNAVNAGEKGLPQYAEAASRRSSIPGSRMLPVLDTGEVDGRLWIAYDAGSATPLSVHRRQVLLPTATSLRALSDVARALDGAAAHGIFASELPPDSVFISSKGARLGDLGTAREALGGSRYELEGDPAYVPPEVLSRGNASERSCVYLFGALLHFLLTGASPNGGHAGPQLPASINAVVAATTATDPDSRPSSVSEAHEMAKRALRGERPVPARKLRAGKTTDRKSRETKAAAPAASRKNGGRKAGVAKRATAKAATSAATTPATGAATTTPMGPRPRRAPATRATVQRVGKALATTTRRVVAKAATIVVLIAATLRRVARALRRGAAHLPTIFRHIVTALRRGAAKSATAFGHFARALRRGAARLPTIFRHVATALRRGAAKSAAALRHIATALRRGAALRIPRWSRTARRAAENVAATARLVTGNLAATAQRIPHWSRTARRAAAGSLATAARRVPTRPLPARRVGGNRGVAAQPIPTRPRTPRRVAGDRGTAQRVAANHAVTVRGVIARRKAYWSLTARRAAGNLAATAQLVAGNLAATAQRIPSWSLTARRTAGNIAATARRLPGNLVATARRAPTWSPTARRAAGRLAATAQRVAARLLTAPVLLARHVVSPPVSARRASIVVGALFLGTAGGLLLASSPDAEPPRAETVTAGGLSVTLPTGLHDIHPGDQSMAVRTPEFGLRARIVDRRLESPPDVRPVRLGSFQAWRHATGGLVHYAIPTTRGTLAISCRASAPLALRLCERTASTLKLSIARALPLAAAAEDARRLDEALAALSAARDDGRARLGSASTPDEQRRAARNLTDSHTRAATTLQDVPGAEPIEAAARRAAGAYASLAASADSGSAGRWAEAGRRVRQAEALLTEAVASAD